MAVEAPGLIKDFNPAWPQDDDDCPEGDDHIRLVKGNLQSQFTSLEAAVTATADEMNALSGATAASPLQTQITSQDSRISALEANPHPTGMVSSFAGATAPSGWVLCDGAAYDGNNATYAALWALIGNTYGGTGISNFQVPDLRGRFPLGAGAGPGLTARIRGETGGAETHQLTESELPAHTHPTTDPVDSGVQSEFSAGQNIFQATAGNTGSVGGDQAHENMPPFVGLNVCIKL